MRNHQPVQLSLWPRKSPAEVSRTSAHGSGRPAALDPGRDAALGLLFRVLEVSVLMGLPFELRLSGALAYCLGLLSWPREPLGLLPSHPGLCPGCLQACCLLTPVFLLPLLPPTSIPLWGMLAPCGPQPAASTGILSDSQTPGLRTQRLRWGFEDPGLEP